jgi:AI-2 transport protein TqsA
MADMMERRPGSRFLFVFACLAISVAALQLAAQIIVPFVLACFLAVVSMPAMFQLRRRGVPELPAIALTVLLDVLVLVILIALVAGSLATLNERVPIYVPLLERQLAGFVAFLESKGIPAGTYLNLDLLDASYVLGLLGTVVQTAISIFKMAFLVGLILIFVLAEATVVPFKFRAILGSNRQVRSRVLEAVVEVQAYLWIKTLMSAGTGIGVGVFVWLMGVDFPVLLGLLAFALNFIPNVGSLLASIPAIVLALILHGPLRAAGVTLGYMAVNGMFGNLVETHLLGRRMGLSPLVIVLSLIFWAWLWGPIGALLAVPLTMVLKITLEHVPDLSWIAVMMDKLPPQARRAEAQAVEPAAAVGGAGE